jgi:DNA-binding NtrC family response regulator
MSPSLNSVIVSLDEVPHEDVVSEQQDLQPIVLIVDDEPLVADTLAVILARAGFVTMTAYDGPTALGMARSAAPHLLISDVAMPEMNGVELALAMLEAIPACKVLLFSGHATSADLVSALDAGHDFRLLAKPVHPTEMLKHVSRTLNMPERHHRHRHLAEVVPIRRSA